MTTTGERPRLAVLVTLTAGLLLPSLARADDAPASETAPTDAPRTTTPPAPRRQGAWGTHLTAGVLTSLDTTSSHTPGWNAGAEATLVMYLTPLVDDEAPYELQPFLQRTAQIGFDLLGTRGAEVTCAWPKVQAGSSIWGSGYIGRYFFMAASLGVGYQRQSFEADLGPGAVDQSLNVSHAGTLGFRYADFRVTLTGRIGLNLYKGSAPWSATLGADWTILRRVHLVLSITPVLTGGSASTSVVGYVARALGLTLGMETSVYHSKVASVHDQYAVAGSVGVVYWKLRHVGASVGYRLIWIDPGLPADQLGNEIHLSIFGRMP